MTGWIVGGLLCAAVLIALIFFVFLPTPSAPYNTAETGFMDLHVPTVPLDAIITDLPTEPGNAAEDYAKAMDFYKAHAHDIDNTADAKEFDAAVAAKDPFSNPDFKACKDLAEMVAAGSKKKDFHYTFVMTPKKLKPYFPLKYARDMYQISLGPSQCYQLYRDRKEYPKADRYLQSMFLLGWHMFNERDLADMSIQGLDIMIAAVGDFQELYNEKDWPDAPVNKLKSLDQYSYELNKIKENFTEKKTLLWDSIPIGANDQFYPGDVFNMAQNEKDHAWKVQAVLTLGAMKFRCINSRGDIAQTNSLINKYLNSDDPLLRAAAECSKNLTKEDYERLGVGYFQQQ